MSAIRALGGYSAIVLDLDGTVVRLRTDWKEAHLRVDPLLSSRGAGELRGLSIWDKVRLARRLGIAQVEEEVAALEVEGARASVALPLAGLLKGWTGPPLGICTMNSRRAAEVSLERCALADAVASMVAREDCAEFKPDPAPLLLCAQRLGVGGKVVYVGDMRRDEAAARAAGMAFVAAQTFNGGTYPFEPPV
jgi:phosphoglycolate phosphatase